MDAKVKTNVKWIAAIGLIAALLITLGYLWRIGVKDPSQDLGAVTPSQDLGTLQPSQTLVVPPTWRGITPGQTSMNEVKQLLGTPDEIEEYNRFTIYFYLNRGYLGWNKIQIWFADKENSLTTNLIMLERQYSDKTQFRSPLFNLDRLMIRDMAIDYGQPDEVAWTYACGIRVVFWGRHGVAVDVDVGVNSYIPMSKPYVYSVWFFEPMEFYEYLRRDWPWTLGIIPNSANYCRPGTGGDVSDLLPKDPFDWDDLLSPTLTPTP